MKNDISSNQTGSLAGPHRDIQGQHLALCWSEAVGDQRTLWSPAVFWKLFEYYLSDYYTISSYRSKSHIIK